MADAVLVHVLPAHTEEVAGGIVGHPALEGDVVDGEDGLQRALGTPLVLGLDQEGQKRGVPVVAVQNLRLEVQQVQALHHRPLEKGVLLHLGLSAAVDGVAEIVFAVDQVDGQTIQLQLQQPGVFVAPAQVYIGVGHILHLVGIFLPHHAVIRRDDPGVKAQGVEVFGQPARHVGQAAGLAQRSALRRRHQHIGQILPSSQEQLAFQLRIHHTASSSFSDGARRQSTVSGKMT